MKTLLTTMFVVSVLAFPVLAAATPIGGMFTSTDLGGQLLTGRASTWRSGINSGLPHVFHGQSWNGTTLGTQWEINCPAENANFTTVDNRVGGAGTVVFTSQFTGGTFTFLAGGWPWGNGTGMLGTTTMLTTVQYLMIGGVSTPVASVVNGNATGVFLGGCALAFAIANGAGAGETTSLNPALTKPATYPTFTDNTCAPAAANAQFGTWGSIITITMNIDCSTPVRPSTWGAVKTLYR